MRDSSIRLTAFQSAVATYVVLAHRQSDCKIHVFVATEDRLHRWAEHSPLPDVRQFYPVHQYKVPPIARARIRQVFDEKACDWSLKCP